LGVFLNGARYGLLLGMEVGNRRSDWAWIGGTLHLLIRDFCAGRSGRWGLMPPYPLSEDCHHPREEAPAAEQVPIGEKTLAQRGSMARPRVNLLRSREGDESMFAGMWESRSWENRRLFADRNIKTRPDDTCPEEYVTKRCLLRCRDVK